MIFNTLNACSFVTKKSFEQNYTKLKTLLLQTEVDSISLFPEVCLTNFYYDDLELASRFFVSKKDELIKLSHNRTFGLTAIEKENGSYYNNFYLFSNQKIVYKRAKYELFKLAKEHKYFKKTKEDDIALFKLDDISIGVLICFELRFVKYWQKLKGADIILISAMWGKERKAHFEVLIKSLAIINQCYVIASDSKNINMSNSSAIISPFGNVVKNDKKNILTSSFDENEIIRFRRYINIS